MNKNVVLMSTIMAFLAVFFMQSYVSTVEDESQKRYGSKIQVLVALKNINEMETLTEKIVTIKTIPSKLKEPTAITVVEDEKRRPKGESEVYISDFREISGMIAMVPIKQGEQITFNKISEPGIRTGLSPQVAPGKRAIAVPVNELSGVGKLLKPGDRVDLIVTFVPGQDRMRTFSQTLFQDVVVLAVGRNVTNNVARVMEQEGASRKLRSRSLIEYDGFNSITIEVDPRQAQALGLITSSAGAQITVALRNNDDTERAAILPLSLGELMGVAGSSAVQPRAPAQTR
jgi:pilus assembly protein CpaB